MAEHTWNAGKVTTQATIKSEGIKTYTCTKCGATKTEVIAKHKIKAGYTFTDSKTKAVYAVTDVGKMTVEYVRTTNSATKITIPAAVTFDGATFKVTKIADNAFKNNKTVTGVTIGSNIKTIGKNAFYNCTKLKAVKIGNNVTTIGSNAFYKCTSLTGVILPSKVAKIDKQAFYGCKKLKSITIKTTKLTDKNVGSSAFKGIYTKATIKVPKKQLAAYKKLLKNKGVSSKAKVTGY